MIERDWLPFTTVCAIVEQEGRFLFVEERIDGELVLNQPAGHLEDNETLLAAAIRETLEETGYHIDPTHLVGIYRLRMSPIKTYIRFAFTGIVTSYEKDRELDEGIERAVWLHPSEIAGHNLRSPLVVRGVNDYLSGRRFPIDQLIDLS